MPNVIKAIFFGLATSIATAAVPSAFGADEQFFRQRIAPILERRCLHCHGDSTRKGNLSLSTATAAFKGGDGGPAIVPGKPGESLLLEMISGEKPAMPQKDKPLSMEDVAVIRDWINPAQRGPRGSHSPTAGSKASAGGRLSRSRARRLPNHVQLGSAPRSTRSSWPSWRNMASSRAARLIAAHSSAGFHST